MGKEKLEKINELTNLIFAESWRKPFQVFIGFLLILTSIKIFMLV
jgi:hypothetical protein